MRFAILGFGQIPMWSDPTGDRPLTTVEEVLSRWLIDLSHHAAGRLAFRTLLKVSEHPVEVEEKRLRKGREKPGEEEEPSFFVKVIARWRDRRRKETKDRSSKLLEEEALRLRSRRLQDPLFLTPVLRRMSVFLATFFSPGDRKIVQRCFSELLDEWQSSVAIITNPREKIVAILGRYEGHSMELERVINHMVRSVWFFRYRWFVAPVTGLLSAGLITAALLSIQGLWI
jgi:hypothetical protein